MSEKFTPVVLNYYLTEALETAIFAMECEAKYKSADQEKLGLCSDDFIDYLYDLRENRDRQMIMVKIILNAHFPAQQKPAAEIPSKADTLASSAYKRNDRATRTLNGKTVYRVFLYKTQLRTLKRAKTGKYYDERGNVLGSWNLMLFNGGDAGYLICTPDQTPDTWE